MKIVDRNTSEYRLAKKKAIDVKRYLNTGSSLLTFTIGKPEGCYWKYGSLYKIGEKYRLNISSNLYFEWFE